MAKVGPHQKQESQLIFELTPKTEADDVQPDFLRQHPDFARVHWLMFPDDTLKAYWDLSILLLLLASVVLEPYKLAVMEDSDLSAVGWEVLDWVVLLVFALDLVLNFFTAYFDEQSLIVSRWRIAKHYLRTWFIVDFLSCFPFDSLIQMSDAPTKLAKLARLPRLYRLVKSGK